LCDLFPNIGLEKSKLGTYSLFKKIYVLIYFFSSANGYNFGSKDWRRNFFEQYAKAHNFDPLNPNNWYMQPLAKIKAAKVERGNNIEEKITVFLYS